MVKIRRGFPTEIPDVGQRRRRVRRGRGNRWYPDRGSLGRSRLAHVSLASRLVEPWDRDRGGADAVAFGFETLGLSRIQADSALETQQRPRCLIAPDSDATRFVLSTTSPRMESDEIPSRVRPPARTRLRRGRIRADAQTRARIAWVYAYGPLSADLDGTAAAPSRSTQPLHHPLVGDLAVSYEALRLIADVGLTIIVYTAEPGSPSQEALSRLASESAVPNERRASCLPICPLLGRETCPVRRTPVRAKTREIRRLVWVHRFSRAGRARLAQPDARLDSCISAGQSSESRSGGGRESNPPGDFRPPTDFEGMSGSCAAFRPVTRGLVFGRRPRTCKDL